MFGKLLAKVKSLALYQRFGPNESAEKARKYARQIQRELERMKLCYKRKEERGFGRPRTVIDRVEFMVPLIVTPSTIRLKVDTRPGKLPTGVTIADLTKPDIADTISVSLARDVMVTCTNPRSGLYFEISEDSTLRGIPRLVWAIDVSLPVEASPLSFMVGISRRGSVIVDLESISHYLVAGATRQGKSIHLWHLLTTFATRNSPQDVRLVLFDLKNGVMFFPFRHLPHLWKPVTDHPDRCLPVFDDLISEMTRRYILIREHGQATRAEYNRLDVEEKLPPIVVFIDELAAITKSRLPTDDSNRPLGKEASDRLALLLQQGAGAGIHFIVATQDPRVEVLSGDIRANITEAIAYRTAKTSHSEIIIGCSGAEKIQNKGRALLKMGAEIIELQTPRILEEGGKHGVYQAVSTIIQRWSEPEQKPAVDEASDDQALKQKMVDYALKYLGGSFKSREVHEAFKNEMKYKRVLEIARELEIDGVLSSGRPGKSRKVISPSASCCATKQCEENAIPVATPSPQELLETQPGEEPISDDELQRLLMPAHKQVEVIDV
jgi:S-DNA-T family DNA segregation ATPase FtsK/SpoIIIE